MCIRDSHCTSLSCVHQRLQLRVGGPEQLPPDRDLGSSREAAQRGLSRRITCAIGIGFRSPRLHDGDVARPKRPASEQRWHDNPVRFVPSVGVRPGDARCLGGGGMAIGHALDPKATSVRSLPCLSSPFPPARRRRAVRLPAIAVRGFQLVFSVGPSLRAWRGGH